MSTLPCPNCGTNLESRNGRIPILHLVSSGDTLKNTVKTGVYYVCTGCKKWFVLTLRLVEVSKNDVKPL